MTSAAYVLSVACFILAVGLLILAIGLLVLVIRLDQGTLALLTITVFIYARKSSVRQRLQK